MSDQHKYGLGRTVHYDYDTAIERVKDELQKEGFGVLTTIDVQATLKDRLGVDFRRYIILGACNPNLAHRALSAETELGLLLPCNVIVYEQDDGQVKVAAMNPLAALGIVDNDDIMSVAQTAQGHLEQALNRL